MSMITRKVICLSIFFSILGGVLSCPAYAISIPEFARQLTGPVLNIAELLKFLTRLTGLALIIGAFVKYFEYRKGVTDITLRTIICLLLGGIALIGITFVGIQR